MSKHLSHREKQMLAKAAERIEFEKNAYNEEEQTHRASQSQRSSDETGLGGLILLALAFAFLLLWLMQDDNSDPTARHCIGKYYQPITTHNPAECRKTGLGGF